jgi:hypothetical protein
MMHEFTQRKTSQRPWAEDLCSLGRVLRRPSGAIPGRARYDSVETSDR